MMHASTTRIALQPADAAWQRAPGLGTLLAVLSLYFVAQILLRLLISDSLELDEAEQMLSTRTLEAGYGTQPPLYAWLQYGFHRVFGVSLLALALLKNLLLFGTYLFTALMARRVMAPAAAVLAALAMMWLPQISWDSQRDLTHSVIVTTISSATLYVLVRLVQRPRPAWYAVLGIVVGLGTLAKYNYVMLVALLAATVVLEPSLRRRVVSPWLAVSALCAAVVVAPHALWLLDHWQLASAGTMQKMAARPGETSIGGWLQGLGSAALAIVSFVTPLWIVLLGFYGRRLFGNPATSAPVAPGVVAPDAPDAPGARRISARYLGLLAAMFAAMVVLGGVTHFKDRWLQPYLFAAPAMFFACFPALGEGPRARAFWRATLVVAVVVLVLLGAKVVYQGRYGAPGDLNQPIGALATALRADGFERGVIVTGERRLAGRLRLHFPRSRIVLAGETLAASADEPLLLIASGEKIETLLQQLQVAVETPAIRRVDLPFLYGERRSLRMQYAYVLTQASK